MIQTPIYFIAIMTKLNFNVDALKIEEESLNRPIFFTGNPTEHESSRFVFIPADGLLVV